MLRSAALGKNLLEHSQVTFGLSYRWEFNTISQRGGCALEAIMRVEHGEPGRNHHSLCTFQVDCKEGDT